MCKTRDPSEESTLLECYTFNISYPSEDEVSLDLSTHTTVHNSFFFFLNVNFKEIIFISESSPMSIYSSSSSSLLSKERIKESTVRMVRTLVSLAQTLPSVPKERAFAMKLFYYDQITPSDYEPEWYFFKNYVFLSMYFIYVFFVFVNFNMAGMQLINIKKSFHAASEKEKLTSFHFRPLRLGLGSVNTPFHLLSLSLNTTIDCVGSSSSSSSSSSFSYYYCYYYFYFLFISLYRFTHNSSF
jgi:hypothetical protein